MTELGPLAGLRVLDLTDDLGRFGTKLLAEYGADVYRPSWAGSRGAPMPGVAGERGGLLDWWFDAAKSQVALNLDSDDGVADYRRLAATADLVIDGKPVGYLAERGIDHPDLVVVNPGLSQVSVTPFGRTGPRSQWQTSDLVAGALGGVLAITGTPDEPLNSWGWQNYNFAGFAAAISGLAAVRSARHRGKGQLVDLSLHEVVAGSIENLLMQYFYDDLLPLPKLAARQGSLHWLGAYEVVPARSGHVMVTPTPQAEQLIDWMVAAGIDAAEPFVGLAVEELLARMPELMAAMKEFAATIDAGELWQEAQKRHIAFGEVQSIPQVAANPQFAYRDLFADIELPDGGAIRGPWRLVRFSDTPIAPPPGLPAESATVAEAAEIEDRGSMGEARSDASPAAMSGPGARPLDGVVVLDLSWVLAGPFSTRLLGDLGADVIKVQTEERATLVNRPDFPYYPVWNRSKRSVTLDLKHPDALAVVEQLVKKADVLVENYSSGVLDRLGLGWDTVREWNDQLVYISMSGCGHDGPWSEVISYAPTIHALCGLTHLTNPVGRGDVGCGFSLNDHAAGFGAAFSVLAALEARNRTGRGQHIDMAQLEVGAYLVGPALVDHFANGADVQPAGNRDGLVDPVPNEVYPTDDGRFLAVTAVDDRMWDGLASVIGLPVDVTADLATVEARRACRDDVNAMLADWCRRNEAASAMEELQDAGVAAGVVQDADDLYRNDPQLESRSFWLDAGHDEFGSRPHDRFPSLWSESKLEPYRLPPAYLGEANFDVWTDLVGLGFEEVAEGIASGLFQ
jgi:crotonobetainyl-CoA:carnitine CoA-transferase CaiB-like acyl-CoA transferase